MSDFLLPGIPSMLIMVGLVDLRTLLSMFKAIAGLHSRGLGRSSESIVSSPITLSSLAAVALLQVHRYV